MLIARPRQPIDLALSGNMRVSHELLSFHDISLLTFEAVLEVVIICVAGYVAARTGLLSPLAQHAISRLNVDLFTPCLVFIKLAPSLSLRKMAEIAVIPLFYALSTLISYACLRVSASFLRLNEPESDFVTAMAVFGNSNSLPVSLALTLAYTLPGLLWDDLPNDTSDRVASRGILYLLIFQQLGQVLRWTWGFNTLLRKRTFAELNLYGDDTASIEPMMHDSPPSSSSSSSFPALPASPKDLQHTVEHEQPAVLHNRYWAYICSRLEAIYTYPPIAKTLLFMNPPLYAMLALVLVASITPLHNLFFGTPSPSPLPLPPTPTFISNTLTKSIAQLGLVLIPLILIVLGSNLAPSHLHTSRLRHHTRIIAASLVLRMILPALVLLPLIAFAVKVINVSILDDPIFLIVAFVLTTSPPAIQLSQITQINNVYQAEMAGVLFWGYVVMTLPMTIMIVVASLEVLEWATS